jgi:hypothetical protein
MHMKKEMRGSEKVRGLCENFTRLTPEQIAEVAGGGLFIESWMIRGIPADIYKSPVNNPVLQTGLAAR